MPNGDNKNREAGGGNKWAVMGGIALNVEYTRKYGFDATAAAKVTAKLVAVPPPTLFQEAVQANIAGRAKRIEEVAHRGVISLSLLDEEGKPVAGARYVVKLKDDSVREGVLDAEGLGHVDGLEAGES